MYLEDLDRDDPDFLAYMESHRVIENAEGVPFIYNYDLGLYLPFIEKDETWDLNKMKDFRILLDENGDQVCYSEENGGYWSGVGKFLSSSWFLYAKNPAAPFSSPFLMSRST